MTMSFTDYDCVIIYIFSELLANAARLVNITSKSSISPNYRGGDHGLSCRFVALARCGAR